MFRVFLLLTVLMTFSCKNNTIEDVKTSVHIDTLQGMSLFDKPLIRRQVDTIKDVVQISNYNDALVNYIQDSLNTENIIWLGRRIAYLGDYKKAITIFTKGIDVNPEDAKLLRHRGHRYISLRQFDLAIKDLESASRLIQGSEDSIEPDGIPNRLNQPVSSLHTNIWYHLGLAYYLKGEMKNALAAFHECLLASDNDDMIVATSHWLYMILRRMNLPEEATVILEPISSEMTIIENMAYHKLLLFYKGEFSEDGLTRNEDGSLGTNEAILYGLGNWNYYNNNVDKAKDIFSDLLKNGNWAGFGYIAAEADLSALF